MIFRLTLLFTIVVASCGLRAAERPDIVLIMVDDMGFSDIGCYGGEIQTPNIDALASDGVRFDQFYNSGRCCPTRATLMTGLHPHQVGIGHMTLAPGKVPQDVPENYQGFINQKCVTIAEVLRSSGYATLMSGKWHLGMHHQSLFPLQRGYDKFFGSLAGATRFFLPEHPRGMTFGNEKVESPQSTTSEAFYTTDAFTDYAIRFISEHHASEKTADPFFLYLAYTAPHWPLQAFEDDVAKYRGQYKAGWEELRKTRYNRQVELGLIDPQWKLSKPLPKIPDWDSLDAEKQDEMGLKMAVYAAMIDRIDQNIGRLVASLKMQKRFDNTLILFLSDNGACAEGGMLGRGEFHDVEKRNLETSCSYGEAWANASSTPFRLYKHFAHEGGTASPFFMHWPSTIKQQADWYRTPAQLIDIVPTLIDVSGADYPPKSFRNPIPKLDGVSLRPAFNAGPILRQSPIFIEHESNAFVRDGKWKLVGQSVAKTAGVDAAKWELYDMEQDRTETNNVADAKPAKTKDLADQWSDWAKRVGVYPKPVKKKRKAKAKN